MTFRSEDNDGRQSPSFLPAAGWFPDPQSEAHQRYWDGSRWTHHTRPTLSSPAQPPPVQTPTAQPPPVQTPTAQPQLAVEAAPLSADSWALHSGAHPTSPADIGLGSIADGQQARSAPATPPLPERGWRPDPSELHLERFWDGTRWTGRTRDSFTKIENPPPEAYAYRPREWSPPPRRRLRAWRMVGFSVLIFLGLAVIYQYLDRAGLESMVAEGGAPAPQSQPVVNEPAYDSDPDPIDAPPAITEPVHQITPADIDYPVFGSTEFVTLLEAGMIVQQDAIDVSSWVQVHGFETLSESLLEAGTQNPYLYVSGWETMQRGDYVEVRPQYIYDDVEAERRRSQTMQAAANGLIAAGVHDSMTATEKVTAINDYIVGIAEYDSGAFDAIELGETSPRVHQSQEAYGILVMGTAVCNGYAMAFVAMAEQAGLETVTVTGSDSAGVTGGSHAWNKVLIDDSWLVVDVTWNDPSGWDGDPLHDYLMISDDDPILDTRIVGNDWVVSENLGNYAS